MRVGESMDVQANRFPGTQNCGRTIPNAHLQRWHRPPDAELPQPANMRTHPN